MYIKPHISTSRDAVYHELKEQILQLDLLPGTVISEKEISVKFNVSRTPVRESFVQLSQEGLLDIYPQRGTVVSLIDLQLVEEARFIREQLERAVISLACANFPAESFQMLLSNLAQQQISMREQDFKMMFELDEAFHRTIFVGCRKLNTWAVIQQINVHLNRTRMLRLAADHRWDELYDHHQQMVEAIELHQVGKAEQLMNTHLHLTIADQAILKEKFPAYFK
ncbi:MULTISPECIES: GntR family transcriptional regulator [unclassified Paenibacillus]|uniref:GntR family transcriptional regulator n=1 Tax=unclassified Paenibacillus TaxID=185978 RepID=UPI000B0608A5|nr:MULTISPECIES: GntR family transcriptional regulator [unclassified Paenibacillus]